MEAAFSVTTKTDQCIAIGITGACGFIINPWSAIGSFAGCCFFMAMPSTTDTLMQRLLLSFFSWVMGYAAGAYFYPGPPWSQEAMLVSAVVSALSSVAFTGIYAAMQSNTDLPRWLLSIVEIVNKLRGK